ncbi:MAG: hypothetical protein GXP16_14200 [Gammaproteobacteria bacterium]|nr:hypothetical protein [Gammaproteobacteria bacterium]
MAIAKYLAGYAEAETPANYDDLLAFLARTPFKQTPIKTIVVVPAYDEPGDFVETLCRKVDLASQHVLLIVVANTPDNAPAQAVQSTINMMQHLRASKHNHLFVIDRVSTPIAHKLGVGLARKIGNDLALKLWADGKLQSPWIYQTDADACLPNNYFHSIKARRGAVVFNHNHVSDDRQLQQAADLYDLHMAYYVAGLTHASSVYAYPTLGSTLVVHAKDYAQVRGFPKRNAAEDFYLLNKLAKIHPITVAREITVEVQARTSHRVPFGTGPALTKIIHDYLLTTKNGPYMSYNWSCFELLKQALVTLRQFALQPKQPMPSNPTTAILYKLGLNKVANNIASKYHSVERRHKALSDWFDGFRTLRFVHQARLIHADEPLLQSLAKMPDSERFNSLQDLSVL